MRTRVTILRVSTFESTGHPAADIGIDAHVGHPQAPWEQNAINPYTFIRETNERQYRPPLPSVTPAPYSQSHHIIPRSHTVAPSQSRSTPRFWDGPPSPISPGTYGTFQGEHAFEHSNGHMKLTSPIGTMPVSNRAAHGDYH
jgi:hypothetical protein